MKTKRGLKILFRILLSMVCTALVGIGLLYRLDTLTLWSVLPGTACTGEEREAMNTMVLMAEQLPEDENAHNMVTSMLVLGTVSYAAKTAQESDKDAQIMSQYTLGLVKGALLQVQGDLSEIEYQTLKLPFKLGNTAIMQRMLPVLQRRTQLPEGFMSEEDIRQEQEQKQKEKKELAEFKEKNVYGRYYLYGNFSEYLEVAASPSGYYDVIRFGTNSGRDAEVIEENFTYKKGEKAYTTTVESTKFQWSEADVIEVTYGGMISPSTYIKPGASDFVFPDSSERRLTAEEVQALDTDRRRIAKNEIYARHNYPFQSEDLKEYFKSCRWYRRGEYQPEEFREEAFSEIERYNLELLK